MRNVWLLADRAQSGQITAIEGSTVSTISELLPLSDLPPELVLGVPEELSRGKAGQFFVFGQYAHLPSGSHVFCLSAPTGEDIAGRTVFTTNLQILSTGERPDLPPVTCNGIPPAEQAWVNRIVTGDEEIYAPVQQMLEAVEGQRARSYSSERLVSAHFKPEWMPSKKKRGVVRLAFVATVLALLALLIWRVMR